MKTILALLSFVILFASCEDVIDIELNSNEPKLVIVGKISGAAEETSKIQLSMSSDYFEPGSYSMVSDASIEVTNQYGEIINFLETTPGNYVSEDLKGEEDMIYNLNVVVEGKEYSAEVKMPQKVNIGMLSFEETPVYMEFSGGYLIYSSLQDPVGTENFYRMKAYNINDTTKAKKSLYVFDDEYVDGKEIMMRWDTEQFMPQDTIVVELQTLDESTYDYYVALNALNENSFIGNANPSNPETNINGDALGYFGAFTVSRDTIVISGE